MAGKITVIGAGVSGQALARLAKKLGADVLVSDQKSELAPEVCLGFKQAQIDYEVGGHSPRAFECDMMLLSSGVSPQSQAVVQALERGIPVRGELDFLTPWLKGKTIAVTGTNGKTTTTALIGHLLASQGYRVGVAGNIGKPLASIIGAELDYCVIELSSFQLYWNKHFTPDVAVLTNIAPDHLDWHGSFEAYVAAKVGVFGTPQPWNWAITQACDKGLVPPGGRVCTLGEGGDAWIDLCPKGALLHSQEGDKVLFDAHNLKLVGHHNAENVAMATAAVHFAAGGDPQAGLEEFSAPPHRCQQVARVKGVTYINDSKGTNVASTTTALSGISGPKWVILGGKGKGESYAPLAASVKAHALGAVLLGAEGDKIEAALREEGVERVYRVADLKEAVQLCAQLAKEGDTVLLSPSCTSWDMYRSYEERGEHFCQLVRALEHGEG